MRRHRAFPFRCRSVCSARARGSSLPTSSSRSKTNDDVDSSFGPAEGELVDVQVADLPLERLTRNADSLDLGHALAVEQVLHARPLSVARIRSEEHTSELQSPVHLVCRLLLEKK